MVQAPLEVGNVLLDAEQHLLVVVQALLLHIFRHRRRVKVSLGVLRRRVAHFKVHRRRYRPIIRVDQVVVDVYSAISHQTLNVKAERERVLL